MLLCRRRRRRHHSPQNNYTLSNFASLNKLEPLINASLTLKFSLNFSYHRRRCHYCSPELCMVITNKGVHRSKQNSS